jgi:hypothetical protein
VLLQEVDDLGCFAAVAENLTHMEICFVQVEIGRGCGSLFWRRVFDA